MLVQGIMVCLIEWKDIYESLSLYSNMDRTKSQICDCLIQLNLEIFNTAKHKYSLKIERVTKMRTFFIRN